MYSNKLYAEKDLLEMHEFIKRNGFAILVSFNDQFPIATHIPLELVKNNQDQFVLHGHIAKANQQEKTFLKHPNILAIFHGTHSYISPSWYKEPNVPTWNYKAVHVYGKIKILGEEELYKSLSELVKKYESTMENPMAVETMPQEMVRAEMKGIVGFEIDIENIEGITKLSQNRSDEDHQKITEELEKIDEPNSLTIAKEMKKIRNNG